MNGNTFLYFFISLIIFSIPNFFFGNKGLVFSLALLYGVSLAATIFISMASVSKKTNKLQQWKTMSIVATPFVVVDVILILVYCGVFDYEKYTQNTVIIGAFAFVALYFLIASFVFANLPYSLKDELKLLFKK